MYTVSVQAHYDAAHFLRHYKGKCERLHGHRYVVEAALQTDLPQFAELETSAENQARWFYDELRKRLPASLADGLLYTRVWETPTQWAQYSREAVPVPAHRAAAMQEGG